jgi:hypothetical protein
MPSNFAGGKPDRRLTLSAVMKAFDRLPPRRARRWRTPSTNWVAQPTARSARRVRVMGSFSDPVRDEFSRRWTGAAMATASTKKPAPVGAGNRPDFVVSRSSSDHSKHPRGRD